MADTFSSVGQAQLLREGYARQLQRVAEALRFAREGAAQRLESDRLADLIVQARQTRAIQNLRQLDAEQLLRDRELAIGLRRLDETRLEDFLLARQYGEPLARGSIFDLFA